jgi:hypothetical protein
MRNAPNNRFQRTGGDHRSSRQMAARPPAAEALALGHTEHPRIICDE